MNNDVVSTGVGTTTRWGVLGIGVPGDLGTWGWGTSAMPTLDGKGGGAVLGMQVSRSLVAAFEFTLGKNHV